MATPMLGSVVALLQLPMIVASLLARLPFLLESALAPSGELILVEGGASVCS
ncbi:hypothetical protein [Prochlorococcus sp. MIT 1306]|uniref:hypothetical protein n=1 Tax=Prochlorococcus sp. MIT 1306 TaxID=1799667 RepID=UPI0007BB27E0|nr:hypothetical protein [Prochlorococcus sp. MIT 1306]KZR65478.1 hypothetical protein PMIT1306_00390 [Prochlorococcus sp. MIT 1306]